MKRNFDRLGLYIAPLRTAALERAEQEFGGRVGIVLAAIQNEVTERGCNGVIRRVADEGNGLEIAALLEYLRHYRFQISLNDLSDETGERVRTWEATARTYLRSIICEGEPPANSHLNGHKSLPPLSSGDHG